MQELRISADNADVAATPPLQPQNIPRLPHQPQDVPKPPYEAYFQRIIPDHKARSQRLCRIAHNTAGTPLPQQNVLPKSAEGSNSTSTDPIAQAQAIYREIHKLSDQAIILYRFHLILFGHSIDQIAASSNLPLRKGQKGQSYAFKAIAEAQETTHKAVGKTYLHSSVYLEFAERGGPGSLISIVGVKSE